MDPAETHWQGPRTAAAASLHRAAAGQRDSGRLEGDSGQSTRGAGNTLAELWIPRRRIGKGPGQPPQLACTGRLRGSATQVAWSRDRALEAREHTLAEQWIPRRHIGKGPGQPPQLACTGRLQGSATQVAWRQSTRGEGTQQSSQSWLDPVQGGGGS